MRPRWGRNFFLIFFLPICDPAGINAEHQILKYTLINSADILRILRNSAGKIFFCYPKFILL